MKSIEFYSDFRTFLADFYAEKKKALSGFSYRSFCIKAGLNSPSIYKEVVGGKRNLTLSTISAFVKGLGLSERDGRFFENLVLFNQAKQEETKQKYLAILRGLRYRKPQKNIPFHMYDYYEKWYNPVIRELAVAFDWNEDYAKLARAVVPAIKLSEARDSVHMQLRLGFLVKDAGGKYRQAAPDITTGAEVNSLAVRNTNREFARLGVESIDRFAPSQRDVSSLVMGIPQSKLPILKQEIAEFRKRLVAIAGSDEPTDAIYTLVLEFFPVAQRARPKGENDEKVG